MNECSQPPGVRLEHQPWVDTLPATEVAATEVAAFGVQPTPEDSTSENAGDLPGVYLRSGTCQEHTLKARRKLACCSRTARPSPCVMRNASMARGRLACHERPPTISSLYLKGRRAPHRR